ncbi:hypothetical protein GCM10010862_29080 [Devosia nitrariae]|uniref:Tetratricopeptide repeat protein n=1 Tax=Devosia nitrariae TaxID=2071872 RepID=A0ABQ5W788_9HYPH|nr:hypothetical protein GCM10010862_29080 [Devosia nitrariae]
MRVQARRLRNLLAEYYEGPGRNEPLRIVLPVGRYVPEFVRSAEAISPAPSPAPTRRPAFQMSWLMEFILLIGIGAGVAVFALAMRQAPEEPMATGAIAPPRVGVVEFQNLTGNRNLDAAMAGLAVELVTDLDLFGEIDAHYGGRAAGGSLSDFVLTGIARDSGGRVQYSAILTRSASQAVEWSHVLERPETATNRALADDLSRDLSLLLGSSRGPLHASMRSLIAAGVPAAEPRSLYVCLMMFHRYRDTNGTEGADSASACFADLPDAERVSPVAKAAMASLIAEGGIIDDGDPAAASEALIAEAMDDGALSSFVWEQRARIHQAHGHLDLARQAYSSALQLNPANADAMAAFALLLALHGDIDASAELGAVALTGTPQPPPDWYYGAPAITAFRAGDFATAAGRAGTYTRADRELGAVLAALAALNMGNADMVNRFLPQVLDTVSFKANGILPQLRKRIGDRGLIGSIRWGLLEAGVPVAALEGPY